MIELIGEHWLLAAMGFLGGIALGLAARLGRFCTLGALEDFQYGHETVRLRMWGLALGSAITGTFLAAAFGWLDVSTAIYLTEAPPLLAAATGGLIFGLGMALAGNCGFGALARLGGGEMRSFVVVVVIGVSALATASGVLSPLRLAMFPEPSVQGISITGALGRATGLSPTALGLAIGLAICALSARTGGWRILWGLPVGLAIAGGLIGTHYVAAHGFEPVAVRSHSFSAPIGETFIWLMLSSGLSPSFASGSVLGVLAGAVAGSRIRGVFRWQACDDHRELHRQIVGAAMMGFGAVLSLGCSIGQGISAFAVLGLSAPVTLAAIWIGGWIGLRVLVEGRMFGLESP